MPYIDLFLMHGISKKVKITDLFAFGEEIKNALPDKLNVNIYPIEYAHLLAKKEDDIYKRQSKTHRWRKSCFFAAYFAADALACHQKDRKLVDGDFVYDLWKLLDVNYDMINHIRPGDESIKVLIAHSLGSEVALSFCWRRRIDYLITMGSPIDWYSSAFAACEYPPMVKLWTNFYNKWDPIHTTIGHFSQCMPEGRKIEDVDCTTFLPFMLKAHSSYWTSGKVHKHIAKRILSLTQGNVG